MSKSLSPSVTIEPATEFKNDHIAVIVEKFPGCIAKLDITVSPLGTEAAYAKAVKIVAKEVSIPGFRKGKAPVEMVKKNYSKFVDREWEDTLLNTSFAEALNLTNLRPYRKTSVKKANYIKKSKDGENKIVVEFEYAPAIPAIDLSLLKLKAVEAAPVTDEAVEKELYQLQLNIANWESIEDKEVEEGDYVDLDILDLKNPGELICADMRFRVTKNMMSPWMHTTILGMRPGEEKVGENDQKPAVDVSHFAEEGEEPNIPSELKLILKKILKPLLPELDEAFAKNYQSENLEELKTKIRAMLVRNSEADAKNNLRRQIAEQLLEIYPFEIPPEDYSAEKAIQVERLKRKVEDENISQVEKLQLLQSAEKYIKNLPDHYRLFLLSQRFAEEHNIKVSIPELSQAIFHQLASSRSTHATLIDEEMDAEHMQAIVYNHVLLEKTMDYMLEKAQFE